MENREYAPRERSTSKFDLTLNTNPLGPSNRVVEKLKNLNKELLGNYYPENDSLISKLAERYGFNSEEIVLGDGCDGCLEMVAHTLIDEGDEVIIPIPTFHRYEFHIRVMGGKPVFVESFDEILGAVTEKTKIIFLCDPNNPTGVKIKKEVKDEILRNFKGVVVIDEALNGESSENKELLKKYNNLILANSFSKVFGLACLRLGFILTNKELATNIRKVSSPFKVNGIAQELAIEAIEDIEHLKKSIEYLDEQREKMISCLSNMGFTCSSSKSINFVVDISGFGKELIDFLKRKEILVTECSAFGYKPNTAIRIAVSSKENNSTFVRAMGDFKISRLQKQNQ